MSSVGRRDRELGARIHASDAVLKSIGRREFLLYDDEVLDDLAGVDGRAEAGVDRCEATGCLGRRAA